MNQDWEQVFLNYCEQIQNAQEDASHDIGHLRRVAKAAHQIAGIEQEPVDGLVLLASAYFHDIVCLPKNHPEAYLSSRLAAEKAIQILIQLQFPGDKLQAVYHAIHAHSFSAKIKPQSLEARIIQDADRMEALGALGILRTFYLSGRLGSQPYHSEDPFAKVRLLDDKVFALDHFYCKLFKLPQLLNTNGGRELAERRVIFLQRFVDQLRQDFFQGDQGVIDLIWICYRGGQSRLGLFDSRDPFAIHRQLQPKCYIIDQLLEQSSHCPWIPLFLDELKEEITTE